MIDACILLPPYERTAAEIVAALFREKDEHAADDDDTKRPKPKFKHTTAHFSTTCHDGNGEIHISGIHEGIAWLAAQVKSRHRTKQPLVLQLDGQECLWEVASVHLSPEPMEPYSISFTFLAMSEMPRRCSSTNDTIERPTRGIDW